MLIFYKYTTVLISKKEKHPTWREEFIWEQTDENLAHTNHGQNGRKAAKQLCNSPHVVTAVAKNILFLRWSSLDLYTDTWTEATLSVAVSAKKGQRQSTGTNEGCEF